MIIICDKLNFFLTSSLQIFTIKTQSILINYNYYLKRFQKPANCKKGRFQLKLINFFIIKNTFKFNCNCLNIHFYEQKVINS